jgi:hypothetical protein
MCPEGCDLEVGRRLPLLVREGQVNPNRHRLSPADRFLKLPSDGIPDRARLVELAQTARTTVKWKRE